MYHSNAKTNVNNQAQIQKYSLFNKNSKSCVSQQYPTLLLPEGSPQIADGISNNKLNDYSMIL
jgi:hypothetical protein